MSKQQQLCQWWFEDEEEEQRRARDESIITKFKPVSIVSEKPSAEQVAQLAPGEYIAWQKASGFIEACVQASSVDNDRIEFECPFCSQYRNKNGTRKCQPVRRMHAQRARLARRPHAAHRRSWGALYYRSGWQYGRRIRFSNLHHRKYKRCCWQTSQAEQIKEDEIYKKSVHNAGIFFFD